MRAAGKVTPIFSVSQRGYFQEGKVCTLYGLRVCSSSFFFASHLIDSSKKLRLRVLFWTLLLLTKIREGGGGGWGFARAAFEGCYFQGVFQGSFLPMELHSKKVIYTA